MTIRFFRRVTLLPGLRLNLSKSGASLSIGTRGAGWITFGGRRGTRVTADVPRISGLYWTETIPPAAPPHAGHRSAFGLAIILLALAAVFWLFHT
jgi:Protein of unknown function (DUF4236)